MYHHIKAPMSVGRSGLMGERKNGQETHNRLNVSWHRFYRCVLFTLISFTVISIMLWSLYIAPGSAMRKSEQISGDNSPDLRLSVQRSMNTSQINFTAKTLTVVSNQTHPSVVIANTNLQCTELKVDLIKLVVNRSLELGERTMETTKENIFGHWKDKVLQFTREGNRQLAALNNSDHPSRFIRNQLSPLEAVIGDSVYSPGGYWRPANCTPRWKVAVLIPYRNRSYHLPILLDHLTPMLRKQSLEFSFYVINQANDLPFNRAMLFNVGFLESLKFSYWDCFILHDVDYIPLSEFNSYGCENMPKSLLSGSKAWNWRFPYRNFFGAVTGLTRENIRKINGFPNVYWGWGGEDDEIFIRIQKVPLKVYHPEGPVGLYTVINHHHNSAARLKERFELLRNSGQRFSIDGLTNIKYTKPNVVLYPLYTNISVDIRKLSNRTK